MSPRRLAELVLVAAVLWPNLAVAGARDVFVVITPPARPAPAPQRPFPVQPPQQWAPPLAMGPTPGPRLPSALCYAGGRECPLEPSDRVGGACTCGGGVRGRVLIPPSRDAAGKPARSD